MTRAGPCSSSDLGTVHSPSRQPSPAETDAQQTHLFLFCKVGRAFLCVCVCVCCPCHNHVSSTAILSDVSRRSGQIGSLESRNSSSSSSCHVQACLASSLFFVGLSSTGPSPLCRFPLPNFPGRLLAKCPLCRSGRCDESSTWPFCREGIKLVMSQHTRRERGDGGWGGHANQAFGFSVSTVQAQHTLHVHNTGDTI